MLQLGSHFARMFLAAHDKKGILMMHLAKKMRRFLTSEDGPTAVEYAVMLALIIIVCLTAINAVGTNAKATFNNVANSIAS
jgi:pilus assembly protein Flp/PilA